MFKPVTMISVAAMGHFAVADIAGANANKKKAVPQPPLAAVVLQAATTSLGGTVVMNTLTDEAHTVVPPELINIIVK